MQRTFHLFYYLIFALTGLLFFSSPVTAQPGWKKEILHYTQSLAKNDGGYGWEDQPDSHLTPTFAVIGILHNIDQLPSGNHSLIEFIRTHHPQFSVSKEAGPSGTEERDLVYQQIQAILWLGGDVSDFKDKVTNWKPQFNKVSNFESHGYPVFIQEMMTPVCSDLLHIPMNDVSFLNNYLAERRRKNGSFNNTKVSDGGDGNIFNTYWGLYTLSLAGKIQTLTKETVQWIQSCQLKNGGFTHQPDPAIGANDDVAYTWAAIKALQLLSAKPQNEKACIQYLLSLRNADGGFGKQAGQPSSPMATYYAIDALKALNAFSYLDNAKPIANASKKPTPDFSGLKVFTVQFEAQGSGSPEEAVMLAKDLNIQLWGAKNDKPGWVAIAQKMADEKKIPVTFFRSDEPYGKNVIVPGLGTFSHILDYVAPVQSAPLELDNNTPWQQFRSINVQKLLNDNGALIWQVSNNEPLGRMLLDETVKNGGYAGISTVHFIQNFLFWLPYLYQYRYQIPFVALQDAHGTEAWWWSDELLHYRTLFLAKEPTYEAMMTALKNNWVVAVRHDSLTDFKTRILGGAQGVQSYILSQQNKWKWWGNDPENLIRPWAAITVIGPKDSFEVARPEKGVSIRIRCWWTAKRPVLDAPLVTLEQLKIDNKIVKTEYVEKKDRRGRPSDAYYLYTISAPSKGRHTIEATFRNVNNNKQEKLTKYFTTEE